MKIYPVQRSVVLNIESSDLGIAVLGTSRLTNGELKAAIGCLCVEWRKRGKTIEDFNKE